MMGDFALSTFHLGLVAALCRPQASRRRPGYLFRLAGNRNKFQIWPHLASIRWM
jgi:hypothetical protein